MRARSKARTAEEVAAIEDLITDLEKRLRKLGGTARPEASGAADVSDFVSDALAGIMKRVRDGGGSVADTISHEATRIGGDTVKRVVTEIEHRPLAMLAIAGGVGYLLGLARR